MVNLAWNIAVTDHGEEVGVVDCRVAGMVGGLPVVEHEGDSQSKVGTKGVDDHGASHISRLQDMDIQGLVGRVEHQFKEGNDDQLEGAGPTQYCSHCDQHCCCCEV